ncbi:MAG: co-chaperone GroES [Propionibacteriaceae bacterium]|nr:co-chaperone GroES [Propionibacteriaceae bacterium]
MTSVTKADKALSSEPLPIHMLHDRILVSSETEGERRSGAGILIPATVKMGHRLAWAQVVAAGPNVRSVKVGDRVLFNPDEVAEVELRAQVYILLRERDLHAVATTRLDEEHAGLYL